MAFWGVEVKAGKPYIHGSDDERGRLHLSQATLVAGSSNKKSIVQCNVGSKKPIYLCSLLPERLETCPLNVEFEEDEEVTFSVIGPHSVHLSGFFYGGDDDQDSEGDGYGSDPYGEGLMETDSEDEDDSFTSDSEDEDEDDNYGMYSTSPARKSGVRIEEIMDDEKPANENAMSKRSKNKKIKSNVSIDEENSDRQIVVKDGSGPMLESEDEDGFPVSVQESKPEITGSKMKPEESNNDRVSEEIQRKKEDVDNGKLLKRKVDAIGKDEETARENTETHDSSLHPENIVPEDEVKAKKKKNKKKKVAEKEENAQASALPSAGTEQSPAAEINNDTKSNSEKKKEKKKKENKKQEGAALTSSEDQLTDKKESVKKHEMAEAKSLQVRSFANGLVIEELAMGKPDGKRASPGKKVSVRYIGKLKKNGKFFDSNVRGPPFTFRLGIGQVIKGWDVGVNGMRIGDKRRLTIPPAMGYGAKGAGPIPQNAWLIFDVELIDVN